MKVKDITSYLESYFPLQLQESWDTCGLQIGSLEASVSKIMIGLNADEETLQKAILANCDMLITHHPFMLEKIENIGYQNHHGKFIKKAIEHNITVYSLHTCLDRGTDNESMNHWLAKKIGINNIISYDILEIGKKGVLPQSMDSERFVEYVKEQLQLPFIRYSRSADKLISKVAICGGSAADDIEALSTQVDCFITGDTKYRHMKVAIDKNILLIDIGHHTEVIMENEVQRLLSKLDIDVIIANSKDYYKYK